MGKRRVYSHSAMNKKCLTCEKLFNKKPNQSVKDWNSRVKYCSKECLHKSRVGKKHTAEHNRKISDALKSIDWSWKVGVPHGHRTSNGGGWKLTEEQKKAISLRFRGKPKPNQSGSKCSFWKGGVTPINRAIRKSLQYKEWRNLCSCSYPFRLSHYQSNGFTSGSG